MTDNPVANRTVGDTYPLSIATSLAIDGILGVHPDHPSGKNLLPQFGVAWINLKTLYRNLYNALDREAARIVTPVQLYDGLVQEVDYLQSILTDVSKGKLQVIYYASDYAQMARHYPHAILRQDNTDAQLTYTVLQKATLAPLYSALQGMLHRYTLKITDTVSEKALLMTHCPIDLFSKGFRDKSLWESHTGAVKDKSKWYTKYYNGKDYQMIPFTEEMIQVFGDNEHFRPLASQVRKQLVELAIKYGWSQVTTREKIMYTIKQMENKENQALLLSIMHS